MSKRVRDELDLEPQFPLMPRTDPVLGEFVRYALRSRLSGYALRDISVTASYDVVRDQIEYMVSVLVAKIQEPEAKEGETKISDETLLIVEKKRDYSKLK